MKVIYAMGLIFMGTIYGGKAQDVPVRLSVDASRQIATVSKLFNGSNIEDLNNQTNGGIFSQLLHGEAFEENIDVDFLNLSREDYSKVYVVLDERKIPHLKSQTDIYHRITWNNRNEKYDFNLRVDSHLFLRLGIYPPSIRLSPVSYQTDYVGTYQWKGANFKILE